MAKRIKYHLIKSGRSYTVSELAATLNVHIRTVQEWIKKGLPVINRSSRPYLISGSEAKSFLKNYSESKKARLENDELFCLKCRLPRKSLVEALNIEFTGRLIGDGQKQIVVTGKCPVCCTKLQRFSSEKNLTKLLNSEIIKKKKLILIEKDHSSLNTDIKDEES